MFVHVCVHVCIGCLGVREQQCGQCACMFVHVFEHVCVWCLGVRDQQCWQCVHVCACVHVCVHGVFRCERPAVWAVCMYA